MLRKAAAQRSGMFLQKWRILIAGATTSWWRISVGFLPRTRKLYTWSMFSGVRGVVPISLAPFSRGPGRFDCKVYPRLGAEIVMESLHLL